MSNISLYRKMEKKTNKNDKINIICNFYYHFYLFETNLKTEQFRKVKQIKSTSIITQSKLHYLCHFVYSPVCGRYKWSETSTK